MKYCCNVGDIIYDIHNNKIYGGTVLMIQDLDDGDYEIIATGARLYHKDDFGVNFFLKFSDAQKHIVIEE